MHVGHRRIAGAAREPHFPDDLPGLLVERAEHPAAPAWRHADAGVAPFSHEHEDDKTDEGPPGSLIPRYAIPSPLLGTLERPKHSANQAQAPNAARWAHRVQLPLLARLLLVARAHPASVVVAQAQGPVVADLVVAPAVPLEQLRSRQSCSAAMAGSTP